MSGKKYYIGLACTYHDPAISILDEDGKILFAEATERSIQSKRASGIVCDEITNTINLIKKYCSDGEEFTISFSWSKSYFLKLIFQSSTGILKFKKHLLDFLLRKVDANVLTSYDIAGMEYRQLSSINQAGISFISAIRSLLPNSSIKKIYYSHHLTHAAYACYTSPFDEGTCVVMDGFGEKGANSIYNYNNNKINLLFAQNNYASLGFFYSLITKLCHFNADKGEAWKVMGLAPYGTLNKTCYNLLKSMVKVNGISFSIMSFKKLRKNLEDLSLNINANFSLKTAQDIAYTGQIVFSEIMKMLNNIFRVTKSENIIYTGGCALNSSFNGQILRKTNFKKMFIPPAPGDDGNSVGAALLSYYRENPGNKSSHKNSSPFLGSTISDADLKNFLKFSGINKVRCVSNICAVAANLIAEGKLIGWIQGRAEFGPRALGNRSILADARTASIKNKLNSCIKFREEFRPFAPSILHEFGDEYFEDYQESQFMERTLFFKKEVWSKVPAVIHVDNTGRLQSVKKENNPKFYKLIFEFYARTGVPLILNTSFNTMGKPIIHSIEDAISVFFTSGLDALVINDYLIEK